MLTLILIISLLILTSLFFIMDARGPALTRLKVIQEDLVFTPLDDDLKGLRILHFSDVHMFGAQDLTYIAQVFDTIQAQDADVILFSGDMIDASITSLNDEQLSFIHEQLSKLNPQFGFFAVLGDDDLNHVETLKSIYQAHTIELLDNQATLLHHYSNSQLRLVGLSPMATQLEHLYPQDGQAVLTLSYDPQNMDRITSLQSTVILAGKTHGGQVSFPLIGSSYSKANSNYIKGSYHVDGKTLFISSGISTSETQARFFDDPSINVYTLR